MDFLFFSFWKSIIRRNIPKRSKWIDGGYSDMSIKAIVKVQIYHV